MSMATTEQLTPEQGYAVQVFGEACAAFFHAMQGLEQVGVDMATALRAMPGSEEGRSMYDELPGSIRMML